MTTPPANPTAVPEKCGRCAHPLASPVYCGACRELYPIGQRTHFELFGIAPAYDLDEAALQRSYLRMSRDIHPDRFAGTDQQRAAESQRLAAGLNAAYQVLRDPLTRAEYLLEVCGGPSAVADKTVPGDVLALALDVREELDAAAMDAARRADILAGVRGRFAAAQERIAVLARALPGDASGRLALRHALNTVKYFQRLLEAAPHG